MNLHNDNPSNKSSATFLCNNNIIIYVKLASLLRTNHDRSLSLSLSLSMSISIFLINPPVETDWATATYSTANFSKYTTMLGF